MGLLHATLQFTTLSTSSQRRIRHAMTDTDLPTNCVASVGGPIRLVGGVANAGMPPHNPHPEPAAPGRHSAHQDAMLSLASVRQNAPGVCCSPIPQMTDAG